MCMFVSNGGLLLSRTRFKGLYHCGYVEPVCDERGRYTRQYAEEAEIHKRRAKGARGARALGRRPRPAALVTTSTDNSVEPTPRDIRYILRGASRGRAVLY